MATQLDVAVVQLKFDTTKARLIEKGFYPYEDKQIHEIKGAEDPSGRSLGGVDLAPQDPVVL